uniref:Ubiquitinyl hydrolase 1 n=1 Tax=Anisakis simplex TaxID=6269 RepID=A0A0M3JNT2_ANISI
LGAEVYAVTVSDQYKADELLAYTADPERLLIRLKDHEPEFTKLVALNECRKEKSDQLNGTTESVAQPIQASKSPVPSSSTNKLLEPE